MMQAQQLSIFSVLQAYGDDVQSNNNAYERLGSACGIDPQQWQERAPIGHAQQHHSLLAPTEN